MSQPKGKQRSIHMDDETFDILERLAGEYKANNSTIVRMALIQFDRGSAQRPVEHNPALVSPFPVDAQRLTEIGQKISEIKHGARDIPLPDPKVSSFSVSGGKVRGKVPRNDREDDGLDV